MENFVGVEGLVRVVRPKINELVIEFTKNKQNIEIFFEKIK
jgi:hypothetical protein